MTPVLLVPLALGLGVLVAGPLLAHLTRRRPVVRVPFGAMMLLERVLRKQRRRRRVQDPWVLLLRVLSILCVVAAVAQPELRSPGVADETEDRGPVVVVLDDSLSMDLTAGTLELGGRQTVFSRARGLAVDFVRKLPDGTPVAAVVAGAPARRLVAELTTDHGSVAAALQESRQSERSTDLAGALSLARRILDGSGGRVVVFTDEAGPSAVPAARSELELLGQQDISLEPRVVTAAEVGNVVVVSAAYGDGLEGGSVRVQLVNYGPRDVELPMVVTLPDGTEITAFAEVPAGGVAEEQVTVPRVTEGGVGTVRIDDPWLPLDDTFPFQLPRVGASRVLVVDGDPGPTPTASEVYFLERALAPWGAMGSLTGGVLPQVTAAGGLPDLDPEVHRVVFLANVSDPAPLAASLTAFVQAGGGLVVALGDNVTADGYNPALSGLLPASLRRVRPLVNPGEDGVPTALPDTSTELFAPFARGGRGGFSAVRWRQLFTVEPYEDVEGERTTWMRTSSGIPLLIERKVGNGRVMLFTGSVDLAWGDFPLQSVFMPWVQRLVGYLGGATAGGGVRLSGRVGEPVEVPLRDGVSSIEVTGPGGPVAATLKGDGIRFTPDSAGPHVVETPGAPPLAWVDVHTDPGESDVRRGPELLTLAAEIDPARYEQRTPLGQLFLAMGFLFGLLSAALSAVRARTRVEAEDAEEVVDAA